MGENWFFNDRKLLFPASEHTAVGQWTALPNLDVSSIVCSHRSVNIDSLRRQTRSGQFRREKAICWTDLMDSRSFFILVPSHCHVWTCEKRSNIANWWASMMKSFRTSGSKESGLSTWKISFRKSTFTTPFYVCRAPLFVWPSGRAT